MTSNIMRAIAIIAASLFATGIVSLIFKLTGANDQALKMTFIAMLSAGFSLDIYLRLAARYPGQGKEKKEPAG